MGSGHGATMAAICESSKRRIVPGCMARALPPRSNAMLLYLIVAAYALFMGVVAFLSIEDALRFSRR